MKRSLPRITAALVAAFALAHAAAAEPPSEDAWRYLEDASDARAKAWFEEQGKQARATLDAIPGRDRMLARIRALSDSTTVVTRLTLAGHRVFYLKLAAPATTPVLCMRDGLAGAEHVVIDPANALRGDGRVAIDWFVPSPDGRHVAVGASAGGSENSLLRVVEVDTRKVLPFEIDRARFNEQLAWHPDGQSFFYARVPEGNSGAKAYANVRVYRHVLGRETSRDEIVFGGAVGGARDVPEFVFPSLFIPLEGRQAYAIARDGVRNEIAVHVADLHDVAAGRAHWRRIVSYEDEVTDIDGWKDDLYLLSHKGAERFRVLHMKATGELRGAKVVVPEGDSVIRSISLARDALYLRTMVAGVDRLERVPIGMLGARKPEYVRTPFDVAITQLVTDARIPGAVLRIQGFIDAPHVVQVDARGNITETKIIPASTADFSAMDDVRLYAPAPDGTKIPVTLFYRKGTQLNRVNPTILSAYGSYGITYDPTFDARRLAWLERGGVIAVAHVRGGGEYGESWHAAGRGERKVNTILDLITVSEFLESYGFTSPARLAIEGTSAGGIPVGGAIVRKPELYAAAIARVPVMDMLRFESMPSGPLNVPEFGSASTPKGLEALRAISPYQQVKDNTAYPAVMLTAGMNDPRVMPWQPGKMAGRLQQASVSGKPVLLRLDNESGHGRGTQRDRSNEELADIYSFLLWQMGEPDFQPKAAGAGGQQLSQPQAQEPQPAGK